MLRRVLRSPDRRLPARGDLLAVAVVMATTVVLNLATAVAMGLLVSLVSFMCRWRVRRFAGPIAPPPCSPASTATRRAAASSNATASRSPSSKWRARCSMARRPPLEDAVDALVAEDLVHVVLDIKRVKDIDATGARVLECIQAKLTRLGGLLAIGDVERERRSRDSGLDSGERRVGPWQSAAFERLKIDHPDLAFTMLANLANIFAQRLRATNQMVAELEA